ncbi:MAG: hypothetical protein OEM59_18410 [Rhodospirillales bacterium]|nr:hypothetical protein [Rhodospirillales bacterium]
MTKQATKSQTRPRYTMLEMALLGGLLTMLLYGAFDLVVLLGRL